MNLILIKDWRAYNYNVEDLTIYEIALIYEELARIMTYSDKQILSVLNTDFLNTDY